MHVIASAFIITSVPVLVTASSPSYVRSDTDSIGKPFGTLLIG